MLTTPSLLQSPAQTPTEAVASGVAVGVGVGEAAGVPVAAAVAVVPLGEGVTVTLPPGVVTGVVVSGGGMVAVTVGLGRGVDVPDEVAVAVGNVVGLIVDVARGMGL